MTAPDYDRTINAAASGGPFSAGRPAFVVIHSTEGPMSDGNAVALAQWFARSKTAGGPGTSATGIFDPVSSVRMLPEGTIPYHCGPVGNPLSNGDEHCGSVNLTREQWLSARGRAMLDASARVQAQRARYRRWSMADCRWLTLTEVARKTVRGFCTHNDIRLALGGTTHSDPGRNFPYTWYMQRVRAWYQDPDTGGDDMPSIEELNDAATAGRLDPFFLRAAQMAVGPGGVARGVDVRTAKAQLDALIDEVKASTDLQGDDEANVIAAIAKVRELLPVPPAGA